MIDVKLRKGFYLEGNVGNNSFGYTPGCKIWVAPTIIGDIDDIDVGDKIAFRDMENGKYMHSVGLKNYVWILRHGLAPIFICDNHNYVLEAWEYFKHDKLKLIHIDQHRDDAKPIVFDSKPILEYPTYLSKTRVCDYIVYTLENMYIQRDYISLCESLDFKRFDLENIQGDNHILNIDLDIFAPEQTIIDHGHIIDLIIALSKRSKLITIATSPLFIDQDLAARICRRLLKRIFEENSNENSDKYKTISEIEDRKKT